MKTPPDGIRPLADRPRGRSGSLAAGDPADSAQRSEAPFIEPTGLPFADLIYPVPTARLRLPGGEVAYCDVGPRGARTLLLLHGLASYLPVWARNLPALSRDHRVVAIDLPGYGKSDKDPARCTMPDFVQVVAHVIDRLELGRVVLVGHSMGAQIALHHALEHPGRTEALVLLAPAGFEPFSDTDRRYLQLVVTPESVENTPPAGVRANLEYNFFAMPPEARVMADDRVRVIGGPDFPAYCACVAASVRAMLEAPVLPRLGEIAQPALLLFGAEDRLIPNPVLHPGTTEALARAGAARLRDGRLVMVPAAGHMLPFEQPDAVNRAILEFLEAIGP